MTVIKKPKKSRKTGINTKAKKKEAVARAVIREGTGTIRVNKRNIDLFEPPIVKQFISEPLMMSGDLPSKVNIDIHVKGGGFMSQAASVRSVIAKSLVAYSKDSKLRLAFVNYDRMLLVDDARRVEPKKPLGTKARKKKQKSKR